MEIKNAHFILFLLSWELDNCVCASNFPQSTSVWGGVSIVLKCRAVCYTWLAYWNGLKKDKERVFVKPHVCVCVPVCLSPFVAVWIVCACTCLCLYSLLCPCAGACLYAHVCLYDRVCMCLGVFISLHVCMTMCLCRHCWVCFATEREDRVAEWVSPCRCKGCTKWIHQSCLQRWLDEKQKGNGAGVVSCPQCGTEYRIVFPKMGTVCSHPLLLTIPSLHFSVSITLKKIFCDFFLNPITIALQSVMHDGICFYIMMLSTLRCRVSGALDKYTQKILWQLLRIILFLPNCGVCFINDPLE